MRVVTVLTVDLAVVTVTVVTVTVLAVDLAGIVTGVILDGGAGAGTARRPGDLGDLHTMYMKGGIELITHNDFGLSHWPIWTDFVAENFRRCVLFFW